MPKRLYPKNKFQKRSQKNGPESSEIAESNLQMNIKSNDRNKEKKKKISTIMLISGLFLLVCSTVFFSSLIPSIDNQIKTGDNTLERFNTLQNHYWLTDIKVDIAVGTKYVLVNHELRSPYFIQDRNSKIDFLDNRIKELKVDQITAVDDSYTRENLLKLNVVQLDDTFKRVYHQADSLRANYLELLQALTDQKMKLLFWSALFQVVGLVLTSLSSFVKA